VCGCGWCDVDAEDIEGDYLLLSCWSSVDASNVPQMSAVLSMASGVRHTGLSESNPPPQWARPGLKLDAFFGSSAKTRLAVLRVQERMECEAQNPSSGCPLASAAEEGSASPCAVSAAGVLPWRASQEEIASRQHNL